MTFAASLAFTLFVGAARFDSTPEQTALLRAEVIPLLEGYRTTGDETPVREAVHRIMGPQWKPNNEFRQQIVELQNASLAASTARVRAAGLPVPPPAPPARTARSVARVRPDVAAPPGQDPMEGGVTDAPEAAE